MLKNQKKIADSEYQKEKFVEKMLWPFLGDFPIF